MAQGKITPVNQMTGHMSKLEKQFRLQQESKASAQPKTNPKPIFGMDSAEKKLFNKFVKMNDSFTEADSTALSLLVSNIYDHAQIRQTIRSLPVLDEQRPLLERRALAYDKAIMQQMNALSIPLTQRLRMNNDMTKILIEEKKLEQMGQTKVEPTNPLLKLLNEIDEWN